MDDHVGVPDLRAADAQRGHRGPGAAGPSAQGLELERLVPTWLHADLLGEFRREDDDARAGVEQEPPAVLAVDRHRDDPDAARRLQRDEGLTRRPSAAPERERCQLMPDLPRQHLRGLDHERHLKGVGGGVPMAEPGERRGAHVVEVRVVGLERDRVTPVARGLHPVSARAGFVGEAVDLRGRFQRAEREPLSDEDPEQERQAAAHTMTKRNCRTACRGLEIAPADANGCERWAVALRLHDAA